MAKQSFMRGAIVLGVAGIATKIFGMTIQVVVARELGAQGFGLFQAINPIFFMLLTISTLALSPALAKVIAENLALGNVMKAQKALKIANITVLVLSVTVCVIAMVAVPEISARWLDPRTAIPFFGALCRIPVVCLASVMSGYYTGIQNQTPPAVAWVIETIVRTVVTIPLIVDFNQYGIAYGALAVMIGAGAGDLAGYLYMLSRYPANRRFVLQEARGMSSQHSDTSGIFKSLAEVALPTTVTNICSILAYAAEPVILYLAFANMGVIKQQATSLYGSFGMAIELLLLPTVLSSAMSAVVVPVISEAAATSNMRLVSRRLNQVIQATFLIALPATVFFLLSGHDLAHALYNDHLAGMLLAYTAPVCVYIYVLDPLAAILQGLNKAALSTVISLVTSGIRIVCIYYFVGHVGEGIFGVATATAISGIISTLLSIYFVQRFVPMSINFNNVAKMVIATALATVPIHQIQTYLSATTLQFQVIVSAAAGFVVYLLSLIYLRVLPVKTVRSLPWVGPLLAKLMTNMPFISQ